MLPARRVYGVLALGCGIGLAVAAAAGRGEALASLAVWNGVLLILCLRDGRRLQAQRVTVVRQPLGRLSVGRQNPVELQVTAGPAPAWVCLWDTFPDTAPGEPARLQTQVAAGQTVTLRYHVRPTQRGSGRWGDVAVRQRGPGGWVWGAWTVPAATSTAVFPDLLTLRELSIRLTLEGSGLVRQRRRLGLGTEFAELREYRSGDDPRLIHWPALARTGRPVVRVLEPEQEQTLVVVVDRGRLMTARVQGLTRFDWALNAALALALAALHRGDRVGVAVIDQGVHCWLTPQRGPAYVQRLIERLSAVEPVRVEPHYLETLAEVMAHQTRRALVVMLTEVVDPTASADLMVALRRLAPRHLPLCVTLADPRLEWVAGRPVTELADAYPRAVALDLGHQRQLALAQLSGQGVLVLDRPADQLVQPLVDRYLQIKFSQRW
ncbi:MAG: DUF58 domain-containing protein [Gloeomargaritaceae cyanobacterium C42_A2020_066]|nr:DUF58 domain-containing protein [Gloeomargaritaceae cyanobacterium C42_A2020_066]